MSGTSKAVLLVADISGYTKFMQLHAVSTSHAKQIIVRLLKSLMQASKPPLKVAELEGDAVFFYALAADGNVRKTAEQVKSQVVNFFSSFNKEIAELNQMKTCVCDACTRVTDLKLKQVIHVGDVAIEKIDRFEKLFGIDVITVHRMLKNSVPSHEYVMMTDPMFKSIADFYGLEPERRTETFEGVGDVATLVFYPSHFKEDIQQADSRELRPTVLARLSWGLKTTSQTLLDLVGLRKIKGAFNNLPI
jgi:hypothetical protein